MSRARTLFLLVLLVGGSLLGALPAGTAQGTPAILCFDRDPPLGTNPGAGCRTSRPPDYEQGSSVQINLSSFVGPTTWISVRCSAGCPSADPSATRVYWAAYRGTPVLFPRDFIDPGPQNNGGNAVLDRAPRYNATWTVTAHTAAPIERTFHVWLYDASVDANYTVRPGASYYLRASGFDAGADVSYRWERKDPMTGRYELFAAPRARASAGGPTAGWFEDYFEFPPSEAANIATCASRFDCYRIVLEGAGKSREVVNVQVGVADIVRNEDTSRRQEANEVPTLQRTMNATFDIDLHYPGGRVLHGPKLLPADIADSVSFGGKALRVAVEKTFRVNGSTHLVGEVPLRFEPSAFMWRATWTIPKDLDVDEDVDYRLRLLEQRDVHGNRIVTDVLGSFRVQSAVLQPRVLESFTELRRTELGTLRLGFLYHNGSAITPQDTVNESPFAGCFVRVPDPPPEGSPPPPQVNSCLGRPLAWGTYYDGGWNFTVTYPRDHADLSAYRFLVRNATADRYGNTVQPIATSSFQVVPAAPVVEFSTVMRGQESEVLERGNRIFLSATITYHDGSPYNHLVRVDPNSTNATVLTGTLIRRGPAANGAQYGPIASEEPFELRESDAVAGRWSGFLQLTDDDTFTPAGVWTFRLDVEDNLTVPNRNVSLVDREVVSSLIRLCPTFQPTSNVPTGATIRFRFKLYYSECDSGREVPVGAIESRIQAKVYRYSPSNDSAMGPPLSNAIIPQFARDGSQDWGLEYVVPNELYSGTYRLVFTASDSYGNRLVPNSFSRPFTTFTEIITRSVITQPPTDVRRGDSATVVFDAREGDVGMDPARPPRIQLERFDTAATACATGLAQGGCWVVERTDLRLADPTLADHVGVFPISVDTPVGLYRFVLQGRDSNFRVITATSANFTVNPTEVTRALLVPPPETIVKGEGFTMFIEALPGDQISGRVVFYNGRSINVPLPTLTSEIGRTNVTWGVPFEAPVGNYTIRFVGRDMNGNVINIITPPIEATAARLEGRLLGQPTRVVERGDDTSILFGVAYPDGGFYAASDQPRVYVLDAAGNVVEEARVGRQGLTFAATWRPDGETPIGEYTFEVAPVATGGTGNLFPPLRSAPFRVVPGTVTRNPVNDLGAELERTVDAAFTVPFAADDRYAGFELIYYGPIFRTAIDPANPLAEVTRTPLPHTLDAPGGKYVARFDTDQQTPVGTYRIAMVGEDAFGNTVTSMSRQFVVRTTNIFATPATIPPQEEFGEGKTLRFVFTIAYRGGVVMDDTLGRPSAALLFNNQPASQRPEIEYVNGRWIASWTAPEILPPGQYTFTLGGSDVYGNPITTYRSTPYIVNEVSLPESFAKVVPGPSPMVALLALGALALMFARRRE